MAKAKARRVSYRIIHRTPDRLEFVACMASPFGWQHAKAAAEIAASRCFDEVGRGAYFGCSTIGIIEVIVRYFIRFRSVYLFHCAILEVSYDLPDSIHTASANHMKKLRRKFGKKCAYAAACHNDRTFALEMK